MTTVANPRTPGPPRKPQPQHHPHPPDMANNPYPLTNDPPYGRQTTTLPPSSIFIGMAYICCRFKVLDFWAGVSENPQSSTLSSLRARSVPAPYPACTERALLMRLGWLSLREFSAAAVARRGCGAWCLTAPTPNGQATADVATGGVFRPGLLQAGGLARSAAVLATALRDGSSSWRERPFSTRRPQSIRRRHRSW